MLNFGYQLFNFWMSITHFWISKHQGILGYPKIHFWVPKNHIDFRISIIRFLDIHNLIF